MQDLRQTGINIVFFETMNAGFPVYPSSLVKQNPLTTGWDPLQVAVEEGHKLGMEVHAWVWCFAVGNRRHNPLIGMPDTYAGPVLEEGGMMDEALRNRGGGITVDSRQNEYWLSPASLKGRELLLNIYKEIVTKYDVDGVHLDYIRYPFQSGGNRMGYEATGRERFSKTTGLNLNAMDDYTARLWIAWKTYQVSSFVQQTSESLKKIKPQLKISAAVFPMKRASRIVAIQQDWETWIDNGWVDMLSPMSYTRDSGRLQDMFEYVKSSSQKHTLIYPGVAMHRLDGGSLVLQLEALRECGSLGSTLFAGAHLDKEKRELLGTGPFKDSGSLTPHRDVVKSVQVILGDYKQKFDKLQAEGALGDVKIAKQTTAVRAALEQLSDSFQQMGPLGSNASDKLQQAQQQLMSLQAATSRWTDADKATHPYRAHYFEKKALLLSEMMGYFMDHSGTSSKTAAIADFKPELAPVASDEEVSSVDPANLEADAPEPGEKSEAKK